MHHQTLPDLRPLSRLSTPLPLWLSIPNSTGVHMTP
jgi:hypothetical protein